MAKRKAETDKVKLTVVIGTLNRPRVASLLIKQLLKESQKIPLEVLVFDQSNNENFQKIKSSFPKLDSWHLFHLDKPNTCRYLNLGWQKAKADIVLYLDDDVELTPETLGAHLDNYTNPRVNGVAGRVINDGEVIKDTDKVGKVAFSGAIFSKNFSSLRAKFVDFPYGCNMSFRRKVLKKLNGFDAKLKPPIYSYNEVDLGIRLNKLYPRSLWFEPKALVLHHQHPRGGTRTYSKLQAEKSSQVNYGYTLAKNFNWLENIIAGLRRLPFQLVREPQFIPDIVWGFIRGKKKTDYLQPLIWFLIISLGIFFRFFKLGEYFTFNFDEEYQALLAYEQVKNPHLIWIGVSASNISYYLGPGFTYLNALLFFISKDPLILGLFGSVFGLVTALSLFSISHRFFGTRTAYFAFALYCASFFLSVYDRRFWNPTPIMFMSLWLFYALMRLKSNSRYLVLLFFLMASALHVHLSLLAFWPVCLAIIYVNRHSLKLKDWLLSATTWFAVTLPLLIFDFVHNFDNFLMPVRYLAKLLRFEQNINLRYSFGQLANTLSRLWYIHPGASLPDELQLGIHGHLTTTVWPLVFLSALILLLVAILAFRYPRYRILSLILFSFLTVYLFYPGGVAPYFLLGFLVLFVLSVAIVLARLPLAISLSIMIVYLAVNLQAFLTLNQQPYGLKVRRQLVEKVSSVVGTRSFYLETRTRDKRKYHSSGGWRYLFKAYATTPAASHADDFFGWIYPDEISSIEPELRVIVSEYPTRVSKPLLAKFNSGVYYAYVVKN